MPGLSKGGVCATLVGSMVCEWLGGWIPSAIAAKPIRPRNTMSVATPNQCHTRSERWMCMSPPGEHEAEHQKPPDDDEDAKSDDELHRGRQRRILRITLLGHIG